MILDNHLYISSIAVDDSIVTIEQLSIRNPELSEYLAETPSDDQVSKLVNLIEVGLYCTKRASDSKELEFVRSRLAGLLDSVESVVSNIPGVVEKKLLDTIGTGEGQALEAVVKVIESAGKTINEGTSSVREILEKDMDPDKEDSAIGKVFKKISKAVDPEIRTSIPATFENAIDKVISPDGQLSKSVKEIVQEGIKPLQERLDDVGKELRARDAVEDALSHTTEKGHKYEDVVVSSLVSVWSPMGARVEHVGTDNKHGDVLVSFKEDIPASTGSMSVIIEAKDRHGNRAGRKVIADAMATAMATRDCEYGIYLGKDTDTFAKEIGDWAEGECEKGRWVATTHANLTMALRYLMVVRRLAEIKDGSEEIDTDAIRLQLDRIKVSFKRIANISTKATSVRNAADDIQKEGADLKSELQAVIRQVEDSMREPV